MQSVTAGGPGLVAVGFHAVTDSDAAVWTSPDGISWSRVAHDEAVLGGEGSQSMFSVTVGGPGLVAVGEDEPDGDQDAAVWTSPDGITWSRVPHDETALGGQNGQEMHSVTSGGPGLVAVGIDKSGGDADAAVWTSPDGITWSRADHDEAVLGGEGSQWMQSVTSGGPGLVAVGWEGIIDVDAAVWTSPDGISWSRVPHEETVFGGEGFQSMFSVTVGVPGLVAVGSDWPGIDIDDVDAAVWTSPDGITWSRVPHEETVFGGEDTKRMLSVTSVDPGLVAVGEHASGGDADAAVWTSPDGITWSRVPHEETVFGGEGFQSMDLVTGGGPGLVAVGSERGHGAVWLAVRDD